MCITHVLRHPSCQQNHVTTWVSDKHEPAIYCSNQFTVYETMDRVRSGEDCPDCKSSEQTRHDFQNAIVNAVRKPLPARLEPNGRQWLDEAMVKADAALAEFPLGRNTASEMARDAYGPRKSNEDVGMETLEEKDQFGDGSEEEAKSVVAGWFSTAASSALRDSPLSRQGLSSYNSEDDGSGCYLEVDTGDPEVVLVKKQQKEAVRAIDVEKGRFQGQEDSDIDEVVDFDGIEDSEILAASSIHFIEDNFEKSENPTDLMVETAPSRAYQNHGSNIEHAEKIDAGWEDIEIVDDRGHLSELEDEGEIVDDILSRTWKDAGLEAAGVAKRFAAQTAAAAQVEIKSRDWSIAGITAGAKGVASRSSGRLSEAMEILKAR